MSAFDSRRNKRSNAMVMAVTLTGRHDTGPFRIVAAIGLEFMGPQAPNGWQAKTPATGEPVDSCNGVTYYLPGKSPETASNNQLDHVFASRGLPTRASQ